MEIPYRNAPAMNETSPIAITEYPIRRAACRLCHIAMDREMRAIPMMSPEATVNTDPADPMELNAATTLKMPTIIEMCGNRRIISGER